MQDNILNVLFIGDVVGRPGRRLLREFIPPLKKEFSIDLVIANGENLAGGFGLTSEKAYEIISYGVDVITSGNHVWDKKEALDLLEQDPRILRPANYPKRAPGRGVFLWKDSNEKPVGILNLQGRIFMEPIDCPFESAVREIEILKEKTSVIIVDFHGEATSEKVAIGWFLDGKVSAVIGTHTHIPTADERILPKGTAYITDVGMVGAKDSVIGIKREDAITRFLYGIPHRFEIEKGKSIFWAVVIRIDRNTGKSVEIKRIFREEI
ncbi:MAG: TIGR00282 family metallophosphoesterase [Acidobacteriota bacterium]